MVFHKDEKKLRTVLPGAAGGTEGAVLLLSITKLDQSPSCPRSEVFAPAEVMETALTLPAPRSQSLPDTALTSTELSCQYVAPVSVAVIVRPPSVPLILVADVALLLAVLTGCPV